MSLQSILRYEQGTQKSAHLRKAYQMQVDRIKNDEMMAERDNIVRLHKYGDFWDEMASHFSHIEEAAMDEETRRKENIVSQRALWNESLEQSSWTKRIKEENKKIKEELRMAAKASLAVR
ncbi:hypothetical protein CHS0354_036809 [Potamilus streckersoni]|uniref:Uncharacterized protein n=1 Tax=Potamilus streckersoni TaxID=2493646 RepID=A0AAE0VWW2_9BIVA|nr:hypothetical protein CHS0354_036809 [Potamilus streckersoni]